MITFLNPEGADWLKTVRIMVPFQPENLHTLFPVLEEPRMNPLALTVLVRSATTALLD